MLLLPLEQCKADGLHILCLSFAEAILQSSNCKQYFFPISLHKSVSFVSFLSQSDPQRFQSWGSRVAVQTLSAGGQP